MMQKVVLLQMCVQEISHRAVLRRFIWRSSVSQSFATRILCGYTEEYRIHYGLELQS